MFIFKTYLRGAAVEVPVVVPVRRGGSSGVRGGGGEAAGPERVVTVAVRLASCVLNALYPLGAPFFPFLIQAQIKFYI